jgi:hypothetical protein
LLLLVSSLNSFSRLLAAIHFVDRMTLALQFDDIHLFPSSCSVFSVACVLL